MGRNDSPDSEIQSNMGDAECVESWVLQDSSKCGVCVCTGDVTETFPEIKPNAAKKDLTGFKSLVDHSSFPTPDYEQWYII